MDWSLLIIGPPGAGKTTALAALSDVGVTRAENSALETGAVHLRVGALLKLVAAPAEPHLATLWDALLPSAAGIVVLLDASRPDPAADLAAYLAPLRERGAASGRPVVVGITHVDAVGSMAGQVSMPALSCSGCSLPVFDVDAREPRDMRLRLMPITALLEIASRRPVWYLA